MDSMPCQSQREWGCWDGKSPWSPSPRLPLGQGCFILAVGEAAVEFPLPVCPLLLTEAVDLDANREQEMQQGYQTQNPVAPTNTVVILREAAHAKL